MESKFSEIMRDILQTAKRNRGVAARLAGEFKGRRSAFKGGMGMGKTAFIRGLVKGIGNTAFVSSPTFAIVNDYGGEPHTFHFDMYRVSSWEDLYSTGFFDYLAEGNLLLIEWSENIEEALPEDTKFIEIEKGEGDTQRNIRISGKE